MTAPRTIRRIFIVGCPRSGTTIIQALLASLPDVMSLGETNYVLRLLGHFDRWLHEDPATARKWRRRLAWARGRTHGDMQRCLDNAFGDEDAPRLRRHISGRAYLDELCRVLDKAAQRNGCVCWVEKTPDHLAYIDIIARHIPDAHFLHVVRNGEDVLASVVDGQTRFKEHKVFAGSIPYWVERWNRAAHVHVRQAGQPQHTVLPYECLFSAPEKVRSLLIELSGTRATGAPGIESAASGAIANLEAEPWKQGSTDGVVRPPKRKFERVFGPELRTRISDHLTDYALLIEQLVSQQPDMAWMGKAATGMPVAAQEVSASLRPA